MSTSEWLALMGILITTIGLASAAINQRVTRIEDRCEKSIANVRRELIQLLEYFKDAS